MLMLGLGLLVAAHAAHAVDYFGAPNAPPWNGLGNPDPNKKHCLCGWVYNKAVTGWTILENQPDHSGCEALCGGQPPPMVPGAPNWKACIAYTKSGSSWGNGVAVKSAADCDYFLPTGKSVGDWEHGYSTDGSAVKMLSFFWWGNPTGEYEKQAFDDADKWTSLITPHGYTVNYWAQSSANAVKDHFKNTNTKLRTIGSGGDYASPGSLLAMTDIADKADDLNNVVYSLQTCPSFVAIKDLVVLAALYKEGGFFFDTTVKSDLPNDGAQAAQKLTEGARALRCPVYVTDSKSGYAAKPYSINGEYDSIFYEVNIMYHPPKNTATRKALACVISSWQGLGFNGGDMSNECKKLKADPKQWNETIGEIITSCTAQAMVGCLHDELVEGRLSAWKGTQPNPPEPGVSKLICDLLKVTKVYKGTGR